MNNLYSYYKDKGLLVNNASLNKFSNAITRNDKANLYDLLSAEGKTYTDQSTGPDYWDLSTKKKKTYKNLVHKIFHQSRQIKNSESKKRKRHNNSAINETANNKVQIQSPVFRQLRGKMKHKANMSKVKGKNNPRFKSKMSQFDAENGKIAVVEMFPSGVVTFKYPLSSTKNVNQAIEKVRNHVRNKMNGGNLELTSINGDVYFGSSHVPNKSNFNYSSPFITFGSTPKIKSTKQKVRTVNTAQNHKLNFTPQSFGKKYAPNNKVKIYGSIGNSVNAIAEKTGKARQNVRSILSPIPKTVKDSRKLGARGNDIKSIMRESSGLLVKLGDSKNAREVQEKINRSTRGVTSFLRWGVQKKNFQPSKTREVNSQFIASYDDVCPNGSYIAPGKKSRSKYGPRLFKVPKSVSNYQRNRVLSKFKEAKIPFTGIPKCTRNVFGIVGNTYGANVSTTTRNGKFSIAGGNLKYGDVGKKGRSCMTMSPQILSNYAKDFGVTIDGGDTRKTVCEKVKAKMRTKTPSTPVDVVSILRAAWVEEFQKCQGSMNVALSSFNSYISEPEKFSGTPIGKKTGIASSANVKVGGRVVQLDRVFSKKNYETVTPNNMRKSASLLKESAVRNAARRACKEHKKNVPSK